MHLICCILLFSAIDLLYSDHLCTIYCILIFPALYLLSSFILYILFTIFSYFLLFIYSSHIFCSLFTIFSYFLHFYFLHFLYHNLIFWLIYSGMFSLLIFSVCVSVVFRISRVFLHDLFSMSTRRTAAAVICTRR